VRVAAYQRGNANCAVGQAGLDAARATCEAAAQLFGCRTEEVFPSSTGIIGVPLPAEKLIAALPGLATSLGAEFRSLPPGRPKPSSPLTRWRRPSSTAGDCRPDGAPREVRIAALCKGSGMIHPQLVPHATMLVYILTDAAVDPAVLDGYLRAPSKSVSPHLCGGDTSTNDICLLFGLGRQRAAISPGNSAFAGALTEVCTRWPVRFVADGEGITHVVELRIEGAATDADALKIAKAIAHSPLVKTAWAGSDPNWAGCWPPSATPAPRSTRSASTSASANSHLPQWWPRN